MLVQIGSGTQTTSLIIFLFMPQLQLAAVPICYHLRKAREVQ